MEKYIKDIIVKAQELVDFWYDIGPAGRAIIRKYDYCPEEDVFERYINMQKKYNRPLDKSSIGPRTNRPEGKKNIKGGIK